MSRSLGRRPRPSRSLAPALALALALTVAPATVGQVLTEADLAVTAVAPGQPAVGAPRDVAATVRNNGPAAVLTFSVVFYLDDTDHPVAGTVEDSRATHQGLVSSGNSATLTYEWTPRATQEGAGTIIAVVDAPDSFTDPNPANDRAEATAFVTRPGLLVEPSWTARQVLVAPGAEHPLPFDVTNTGNVEGTFAPELTQPDAPGWTLRVAPAEARLLAGEERTFVLTVQPPADAPAGSAVNESNGLALQVIEEGYEDSDVGVADVLTPDVAVAPQRALVLTATQLGEGRPGATLTATLTVDNDGNQDETVDVARSATQGNVPHWWAVDVGDEELEVDAFGTGQTTLSLQLPANATAGIYELALSATGEGGALPPVARASLALTVLQVHRLTVTPEATALELLADEPGLFVFTVGNEGNGPDEIALSAGPPGEGWEVTPMPLSVAVPPGAETEFTLRVRPRAGTAPGAGAPFDALFTTQGGEEHAEQGIELTVTVLEGSNVHLVNAPRDPKIDPARGLSLPLQLVNGGNRRGNATVEVGIGSPWQAFTNVEEVRNLDVLGRRSLTVTVTAPEGSLPGESADLSVDVGNGADGPAYADTVHVIVGGPDLAARVKDAPSRAPAGDEVAITVVVDSRGLKAAPATKLVLDAQGNRGTRTLATWDLAGLPTGTSEERTAPWDTTGWAGTVLLTAHVDPDNTVAEEDEANNEESHPVFAATTEIGVQVPPTLTADPGQRIALTTPPLAVTVTNRGNDRGEFVVRVADEGGWSHLETTVQLAAGAAKTVPVTFTVPRPAQRLVNNFTAHVTQAGRATGEASWALNVRDVAAPRADGIAAEPTPRWGIAGTHTILWDDGTGVRGGNVHIIGPNDTEEDAAVAVTDGTPRFTWTPRELGPHQLIVTLTDLAGNTAPSLPTSLVVGEPEALTVTAPDRSRVRPGALVPLTIVSPAPIDRVTVLAIGLRTQLPPPYRINTTGWSEGEQGVEVTVEDALGRTAEHLFTVVIDATRPTLVDANAQPSRPKAGEDVVATLTFDEAVAAASIVLVGKDGLRTKHDAVELSSTTWEARFQLPSGRVDRTDVQAKDLAGNDMVAQGGLDLKSERGVPGFGVLTLIAACAIALAMLRGRTRS